MFLGWLLAFLLLGDDASRRAPAAPPAPACPQEAEVALNVGTWKAALKRAETSQRRDEVLSEMKLSLEDDADVAGDQSAAPKTKAILLGIEDSVVPLGEGERPDRVVQVRYSMERSDEKIATHLVQVLRPLDKNRWCALGATLSRRGDPDRKLLSYQLSFVPLLSARTRAIETQRTESQLRLNETHREYWVVDGFALRKVFDQKLLSMQSAGGGAGGGGAGTTTTLSQVTLAGGFPRRIQVREVTKHASCDVRAGDAPCDDSQSSPPLASTYTYDGTSYVRRK